MKRFARFLAEVVLIVWVVFVGLSMFREPLRLWP
jgi:hypothetical protein